MSAVARLSRAELLKLRTTRAPWGIASGLLVLVAILVCVQLAGESTRELRSEETLRQVLSTGGATAPLFVLALAILGMAGEYRHATIAHTVFGAPSRWHVIASKLLVYACAGLLAGAAAVIVTYAIAGPWMASKDAGFALGDPIPRELALGSMATCAMLAALAVGVAALIRDQVVALLVAAGWTLVVDSVAMAAAPELGKFFPGGAQSSLVGQPGDELLPAGTAALVLLAYTVAFAAGGAYILQRRDLS